MIEALKSEALLNESVGASYIDRNWPPALKESGAWPLASLRQSFLNGSLTRLVDPDAILRSKIAEFVGRGDFGLASGQRPAGGFERTWFEEIVPLDEIAFDAGVFLVRNAQAAALKSGQPTAPPTPQGPPARIEPPAVPTESEFPVSPIQGPSAETRVLRLAGAIPPEVWNRLGTKILPKLRAGSELRIGVDFSVVVKHDGAVNLITELRQILQELGLADSVSID